MRLSNGLGWWGSISGCTFGKSKLFRLGDRSGELLYGMERVESNGIRDEEWKELVMWGRPRV